MSCLTIIWSLGSGACGLLALMHLFLWLRIQRKNFYLWSAAACLAASMAGITELGLMKSQSTAAAQSWLYASNFSAFLIIVALTWFVYGWFQTGRRWLALSITGLWSVGLLVNILLPGNLTFSELTDLATHHTTWGETYATPIGTTNPFIWLPNLASLLFFAFVFDASLRLWKSGHHRRAAVVGGLITVFILLAGIHTGLVDAQVVSTPYLISFFFLAIVLALSFELVQEAARAGEVVAELRQVRCDLEHFGRINLLGELASALAHEINQPLSAILTNAQAGSRFLKKENPDLSEIDDILHDIVRDDNRAQQVIQRLRTMLAKGEVEHQAFDLITSIEEVATMLHHQLHSNSVELEIDLKGEIHDFSGDRVGIQQVMMNLLLNAESAVSGNPKGMRKISIRNRFANQMVEFLVNDNGSGIEPVLATKIFTPFYTTKSTGLGMGLAICKSIIEDHGGEIKYDYQNAQGATFIFTLPLNGTNRNA
ncbi:MAG: HAMP domain-containing sensor histidine kinase [Verrucomicrobiota bacterium]